MGSQYISTHNLRGLSGGWKEVSFSQVKPLKKWGLVGFRLNQQGSFLDEYQNRDKFSLTQSFDFCADNNVPIAQDAEAIVINPDPAQGGLDFLNFDGELDAAIISYVFKGETPGDGEEWRNCCLKERNYYTWMSPSYNTHEDWQNSAARLGLKMVFVVARDYLEIGTRDFEYPGSLYQTLLGIRSTDSSSIYEGHKVSLGVHVHKDYVHSLGFDYSELT